MSVKSDKLFSSQQSYDFVFWTMALLYALVQMPGASDFFTYLRVPGSDDAVRLVSVRDLVAGQSWYDTIQYRLLPEDGLPLHWSRYIDGPLAALNIIFSWAIGTELAEQVVAALWPAGLYLIFLGLSGKTTRSVFGTPAACYAMIVVGVTPIFSGTYFPLGRVDHHNIQILAMLFICATLMVRANPWLLGIAAGGVAAFSLAIGLETIVFIAVSCLILILQHVASRNGATSQMIGFGASIGLTAPLLFLGQTAPSDWFVSVCDELSIPYLGFTSAAATICLIMGIAARAVTSTGRRFILAGILGSILTAALYPLIAHCRHGPYADLPAHIQSFMGELIIESMSAFQLFVTAPPMAIEILAPLYSVTFFITCFYLVELARSTNRTVLSAPGILVVFLWFGTLATMFQVRAVIMGLAVLPPALGYIATRITDSKWAHDGWTKTGVILVLVTGIFLSGPLAASVSGSRNLFEDKGQIVDAKSQNTEEACLHPEQITKLNGIPPGLIIAPINFGPRLLLHTNHSIASAPYHRNAEAMANGIMPFVGVESEMKTRVQKFKVDLVLVCAGHKYGSHSGFGSRLAGGAHVSWLKPVNIGESFIRVWKVLRSSNGELCQGKIEGVC